MSMLPDESLRAAFPLMIREVRYTDPVLNLSGDDWWLTLMCPWVTTAPNRKYTWESETVEDDAWDLIDHSIVSVLFKDEVLVDPIFRLTGNVTLSIFADTDWDPWTLHVPGLVLVGSIDPES